MLVPALLAASALLAVAAPAQARQAQPAAAHTASAAHPTCLVRSLPSFVDQGELTDAATVADVVEVECNPYLYGAGAEVTITSAQLYYRCQKHLSWYVPNTEDPAGQAAGALSPALDGFGVESGPSVNLRLDADGNATVALLAGPNCMAGESLITLDEDEAPYETFTTSFQVLPPATTPQGVSALPPEQVEDATSSAVATVVQAELPGHPEAKVRLAAPQLYDRCKQGEGLIWVRENGEVLPGRPELAGEEAVQLDDDGNGFAILIGSDSCAAGTSLIEADLEEPPFTTETTTFTVLPPQPTEEPSFTIEKLQEIEAAGRGFTTEELTGEVGQTVDYRIVVTNTAKVTETFSDFSDPHCDPGTIAGGPGASPLAPGQSTTYTCTHLLAVGRYVNEATVTGESVGGIPLTETSNQVLVTVPVRHGLAVEKLQKVEGRGFTKSALTGKKGGTVEYEIVVKNTGNVPLTLSDFSDPNCAAGTIVGGPGAAALAPGESSTYTCSRTLPLAGKYTNEASVTATPPGEAPFMRTSNEVEVEVPVPPTPKFTIEKLQRIEGVPAVYTIARLTGKVGQTVEYKIVVTNTGNVALTFSGFSDPKCDAGTIKGGPGETPLAPGDSTTYTCSHLLTGTAPYTYTNKAEVTGTPAGEPPITHPSNEVLVNVESSVPEASFTIEKRQRIDGVPAVYTIAALTGKVGQTVEYEIVVTNTGQVPLTFSGFSDPNCDAGTIKGGPTGALAAGESSTYTCDHLLTGTGPYTYTNVASVTGKASGETPFTESSKPVEVNVPGEASFTITKYQEIEGSGKGFTTEPLTGEAGQTVEYEIVVKNTGEVPLTFSSFSDPNCDASTIKGGPGGALAPGESSTYTCSRALTVAGSYTNVASVAAAAPGEAPFTESSEKVEVTVPEKHEETKTTSSSSGGVSSSAAAPKGEVLAACAVSSPVLHGASGPKRKPFKVSVSASGIEQITFYLDGRKLKTLKSSQAKHGEFTIEIDPRKLSYGGHHVSVKAVMSNPNCAPVARSSAFVHPRAARVAPKFTG